MRILIACEKNPKKQDKDPVTSVTLKHRIVLELCFCAPEGIVDTSEFISEHSLQLTIPIFLYTSMKKQRKHVFPCVALSATCYLSL